MRLRCEHNCQVQATIVCTWGEAPQQTATVCDKHAKEIWDFCVARVNAGALIWINEAIG